MLKKLILISVVAISLASCGNTTRLRSSQGHQRDLNQLQKYKVLPPQVVAVEVDASGREKRLDRYEDFIGKLIGDQLVDSMSQKGYDVSILSGEEIVAEQISDNILDINDYFNYSSGRLYANTLNDTKKASNIDYTLACATKLNGKIDAEVLVVAIYDCSTMTYGRVSADIAKRMLMGPLIYAYYKKSTELNIAQPAIKIALIDLKSGKLLWSSITPLSNNLLGATAHPSIKSMHTHRKNIKLLIESALKDLPKRY